jgi:hypothetical protein
MDKTSLIYKVLEGEASEAEKAELSDWISASEENKSEYQDIKLLWEISNDIINESDDHFYDDLRKIKATMQTKNKPPKTYKNRVIIFLLIIILILAAIALYVSSPGETVVSKGRHHDFTGSFTNLIQHNNIQSDLKIPKQISWCSSSIFSRINRTLKATPSIADALDCDNFFESNDVS